MEPKENNPDQMTEVVLQSQQPKVVSIISSYSIFDTIFKFQKIFSIFTNNWNF